MDKTIENQKIEIKDFEASLSEMRNDNKHLTTLLSQMVTKEELERTKLNQMK